MPRSKSPSLLEGFQVDIDNRFRSYGINFDRGRSASVTSVTGTSENPAASESVDDDVVILGEFNPTQKEEQPTYLSSDTDDGGALNSAKNSSQTNNARGSAQTTKAASGKAGMERARTCSDCRDSNGPGPSSQQRRTSANDTGLPSPVPTPPDVDELISEPADAVDNGVFYVGTAMHSAKPTTSRNNSSCKESQRSGDKARASGRTPSWLTNSNYTNTINITSEPCHSASLKRNAEKTPEAGLSKKRRNTDSSDSDVIIVEQNDCKSKEVNDVRIDNRNLHSKSQTSTSEREPSMNSVCNDDHERSHSREENIRSDIVDYARLQVDINIEGVDVSSRFECIHHETSNPRSNPNITDYQDNSRNKEPRSWRESTNHDIEGSGRDNKVKSIDARDKDVRRTSTEFRNQMSSRDAGINFRGRSYEENTRRRYSEEEKNHKGSEEDNWRKNYETDSRHGYRSGDSRGTSGENSRNGNGRQDDRHGYWHHDSRHEDRSRSHYKTEHLHHQNRNKHENWNRRKRSDDSYRGYGSDKDWRGKESYKSAKYKNDFSGKHREMKLQETRHEKSCSDSRGDSCSDRLRNDDRINPTTNDQTNLQRDGGQNVSTNAAKGSKQSELVRNQIRRINAVINGSENPKPASFANTASNERVVAENDDNFNRVRTSKFSNDRPSTNPVTPSTSNMSSSAYAGTPAPNTNYDDKKLEIKNAEKLIEKIKTCHQCKMTFPTRKEAIKHLKNAHDKKLCFFCCVAFTTKKIVFVKHFLDAHAKDDKDQKAHCPLCMEKFGYDGIYIHLSKKHFQHLEVRHNDSKRKKTIDRKSTGKTTPPRPNYHHNRREQPVGYKRFQQNDTRRYDTFGSSSNKSSTPISKSNPFHQVNNAETHVLQKSLIQEPSNDTNASQSDNPEHNMAFASRKTQFKIPKKINTE